MRSLIKLGVLALAGYGAKQLYDRWGPSVRDALLDPTALDRMSVSPGARETRTADPGPTTEMVPPAPAADIDLTVDTARSPDHDRDDVTTGQRSTAVHEDLGASSS